MLDWGHLGVFASIILLFCLSLWVLKGVLTCKTASQKIMMFCLFLYTFALAAGFSAIIIRGSFYYPTTEFILITMSKVFLFSAFGLSGLILFFFFLVGVNNAESYFKKRREQRADEMNVLMEIARRPSEVTVMGNYFRNINAPIFNGNTIQNSIITLEKKDPDIANSLLEITKIVQNSGNKEAGQLLEGVSGEVIKSDINKPVLRSLWDGLIKLVPDLTKMTEATSALVKLFM